MLLDFLTTVSAVNEKERTAACRAEGLYPKKSPLMDLSFGPFRFDTNISY